MSLRLPQPVPPVPDDTARIARAAFPHGNPYLRLRDRLGPCSTTQALLIFTLGAASRRTRLGAWPWSRSCSSAKG